MPANGDDNRATGYPGQRHPPRVNAQEEPAGKTPYENAWSRPSMVEVARVKPGKDPLNPGGYQTP